MRRLPPRPQPRSRPFPGRRLFRVTALVLAALTLAALTLVLACRTLGVDAVTPVPQMLAFLPWLLVPAAAALLLAALSHWRAGLVWALVVLAVTGLFLRPYEPGGSDPHGPVVARIEVLASNVEFGHATAGLVTAIHREKPDLVFVEECESGCARLLAKEVPTADFPYRHIARGAGSKGSVILSAVPLTDTAGITSTLDMPGSEALIGGLDVQLQLAHPLPPIPGAVDAWREELGKVRAYAASRRGEATIIAGDFNATRDHAAFRDVLDAGAMRDTAPLGGAGLTPSWPSFVRRPLGGQIDHVLVSDDFSVRNARFLDLAHTDHRALLVTLDLHGAAGRSQN